MDNSQKVLIDIVIAARQTALTQITAVEAALARMVTVARVVAVGLGVLGAAMLIHGVQSAAKFQDSMELLRTQAGATQAQVDSLKSSVLSMAMEPMGQSAEHLAEGLYHIESAMQKATGQSVSNAKALDILHTAAEGARVGHANLETVSNALIGTLVSEVGGVKNATSAMAELNAIVGSGNVRMQAVAESIGTGVLPVFASAGLTIQDYGAALATATDNSMQAENAANRLRTMIQMMEAPSKAAIASLKSIGITQVDINKSAEAMSSLGLKQGQLAADMRKPNGLLVAMTDLRNHLIENGYQAKTWGGIVADIFGKSRSSAMPELLLEQLNRLSSKYKQQAADVNKWAADVNAAESTVIAKWDQLKSQFNALGIIVSSVLLPVLGLLLTGLVDIGQAVGAAAQFFPQLTTVLILAAAAFAGVNIAMLGGELAHTAYLFSLRTMLPVISHTGAQVTSFANVLKALSASELQNDASTRQLAVALGLEANATKESIQAKLDDTFAAEMQTKQVALRTAQMKEAQLVDENSIYTTNLREATALKTALALEAEATAEELESAARAKSVAQLEYQQAQFQLAAQHEETLTARSAIATLTAQKEAAALELKVIALNEAAAAELAAAGAMEVDTAAAVGDTVANGFLATSYIALSGAVTAFIAAASPLMLIGIGVALAVGIAILIDKVPVLHQAFSNLVDYLQTSWLGAEKAVSEGWQAMTLGTEGMTAALGHLTAGMGNWISHNGSFLDGIRADASAIGMLHPVVNALGSAFGFVGDHVKLLAAILLAPIGPLGYMMGAAALAVLKLHDMGEAVIDDANKMKALATGATVAGAATGMTSALIGTMATQVRQATATLQSYGVQFTNLAAGAYADHEAALHQNEAAWTSWANTATAAANKMLGAVTDAINKVKTQLATPLPELRLPTTPNAPVTGTSTSNMVNATSAGPALVLAPEAEAALKRLQDAFAGWPPQFKVAMDSASASFQRKLEDAYNSFVSKINGENTRHEAKIVSINTDEEAKVKSAREAAQNAMNSAQATYVQQLQNLNQTHENRLQNILQTFENQFQTMLANFQAQTAAIQQHAEAFTQQHQDALAAMQASEQAHLQDINDKAAKNGQAWVDQQKTLLMEAYHRAIDVEDAHYRDGLALIATQQQQSDASFNRQASAMEKQGKDRIAAEQRAYDESVVKLDAANRAHETGIAEKLQQHVAALRVALEDARNKENALHAADLLRQKELFDEHARKISEALNPPSASKVLSDISTAVQANYDAALAQATLDELRHGSATRADLDALQRAAKARDALTNAENEATKASGTYKTAAQEAAAASKAAAAAAKEAASALKAATPTAQLQKIGTEYDNAVAALELAMYNQTGNYDQLTAAAAKALEARNRLTDVENRAATSIALAAGDITDAVDALQRSVQTDINKIASDMLNGTFYNNSSPGTMLPGGGAAPNTPSDNLIPLQQENERHENQTHQILTSNEQNLTKIFGTFETNLSKIMGANPTLIPIGSGGSASSSSAPTDAGGAPQPPGAFFPAPIQPAPLIPFIVGPTLGGAGGPGGASSGLSAQGDADLQQLIQDYEKLHELLLLEQKAALAAALATGDWATVMSVTQQMIKDKVDAATGEVVAVLLGLGGSMDDAIAKLAAAATAQEAYNQAKAAADALFNQAMINAAIAVGDWTTAVTLTEQKIKDEVDSATNAVVASLLGLGGDVVAAAAAMGQAATDQERLNLAQQAAAQLWNTAMMNAALAAGDLAGAFDLVKKAIDDQVTSSFNAVVEAIRTGQGSLTELTSTYQAAKAAQDQLNDQTARAYAAVGDFTDALSTAKKAIDDNLTNAENKYASDLLNGNVAALEADKTAIMNAAQASNTFARATDTAAAYAAQFKGATFDQASSAELKTIDDNTKLIDANTTVIAAQSALQTAILDNVANQIADQTAIISAEGGVSKAMSDASVKAIQDGSAVTVAQIAVANATDTQALAAARATLKLAQDKLHFDSMASSAALYVAQTQLRADQDKAILDQMTFQAQQKVLSDTLVVDQLKVKLQQDQNQMDLDQLKTLVDIDQALGGGTDAQKMIASDQAKIAQDNADIAKAQQQQAIDQAQASAQEAAAKIQEAQDAQTVELAKQRQTQIESAGSVQEAMDQASIDQINAINNAASKSASDIVQAIKDTNAELRLDIADLIGLETRGLAGLSRIDVTGSTGNMMNGWASDAARQAGAPG